MARILFLDVDGAPFVAFEMLTLLRRGHEIAFAGSRPIPESLKSGELEPLRDREVLLPRFGPGALAETARALGMRSGKTLAALTAAIAAYRREPAYLGKLLATLPWTLAAARWAESHGVTHVHANWAHLPATSAWIVWRITGIPFSFSGHAGRDLFRTEALLREKAQDARFVVVCNRAARDRLVEVAGEAAGRKVHVCHHGVDLTRFRPERRPDGYVLSVGNLDPVKGFDAMIRALALLRDRGVDVRYRVIGEGPESERLQALAQDLRVEGRVELHGRAEGEDLVEAYRRAALLVAPSRILPGGGRDGLPNVILEAMAVGAPVVASHVAAIPEAVEHETTGLLVAPEDPFALAAAVTRFIEDTPLAARLAETARNRVTRDFDREGCAARFVELFEKSSTRS